MLLSALFLGPAVGASAAGLHVGEASKIEARVEFLAPSGETYTGKTGITYTSGGWSYHEDKVYVPSLWGSFPLYFVGQNMRFKVTLTNHTQKGNKTFKVRVQARNHVLETDGSEGMELAPQKTWIVSDLGPGQSKSQEFSIYIAPDPNLPSGLDVTRIRILHLNEGANEDAGLIKEATAVWCPPALKDSPTR